MFNPSAALFANTMLMFRLRFFHNKKPAEAGFLMLPYHFSLSTLAKLKVEGSPMV
jgi:hypothetical protein